MFHSEALLRTAGWETASQITLRNCSKEVRQELGYIGIFAGGKKKSQNIKRLLLITQYKHLKAMILVFFYVWEEARVWAHGNYSLDM